MFTLEKKPICFFWLDSPVREDHIAPGGANELDTIPFVSLPRQTCLSNNTRL